MLLVPVNIISLLVGRVLRQQPSIQSGRPTNDTIISLNLDTLDHIMSALSPQRLSTQDLNKVPVGQGATGAVYAIRMNQRMVACKCFREQSSFQKESDNLERLKKKPHRHVVLMLSAFEFPLMPSIVISPVAECNLKQFLEWINYDGADTADDWKKRALASWCGCLASALKHLHKESRLKHKDIKPDNILVVENNIKITDFGISNSFEEDSETSGPTSGTTFYMPPEAISAQHRDVSQDVWALGLVFVDMMNGKLGKRRKCYEQHLNSETSSELPYKFTSWINILGQDPDATNEDRRFLTVIESCLQVDRRRRPSITTLQNRIEQAGEQFIGKCCSHHEKSIREEVFARQSHVSSQMFEAAPETPLAFLRSIEREVSNASPDSPVNQIFRAFATSSAGERHTLHSITTEILYFWAPSFCPNGLAYWDFCDAFIKCLETADATPYRDNNCLWAANERPFDSEYLAQLRNSVQDIWRAEKVTSFLDLFGRYF